MIGNDVIDLGDPETQPGALHPRFDERVFDATELYTIRTSNDVNYSRWLMWAAKESAFKILRRSQPDVVFSPSRLVVQLDGEGPRAHGHVECDGGVRIVFSVANTVGAVHVVARTTLTDDTAVVSGVQHIEEESPSAAVRKLAVATLAPRLDVNADDLQVVRTRRVPHLHYRGHPIPVALSLSHHGRCVAFAAALPVAPWRAGNER